MNVIASSGLIMNGAVRYLYFQEGVEEGNVTLGLVIMTGSSKVPIFSGRG